MALGKLQIDLEARIAKFESDMGRAARILQRDMVNAQRQAERANNQMRQTMERNAQRIEQSARSAAVAIGGVFAIQQLVQYAGALARVADGYSNVQAKVRLAAGENANMVASFDKIFGVAQRTYNSLEGTAALVQRGSMALQAFGQNAETAFGNSVRLAEIFNKSLVVSGASTAEAASAAQQFSQALASGKFSGDEFRTVMEANSFFAKILADSLGVNIAQLREMSKEGKLTTQSFLDLLNKTGDLEKLFAGMPLTIGRAKTQLDNAFTKFIGQADQANGTSRAIAASISALAQNIGPLVSALGTLGVVALGAFSARTILAVKAYGASLIEQAAAARASAVATQQGAAADAAAASQSLLKARGEQVAAQAAAAAAVVDRERIVAAIALARAQEAAIRANALRATSEIELARLSQQLTAVEGARAAATRALGEARAAEVRANAALLASNRALQTGYVATGNAGAAAAAKITIGMRAAAIAQNAMTLATRGFTAALALVGGPLGALIIGVGLLAMSFSNSKAQADAAASSYQNALGAANNFFDFKSRESALNAASGLVVEKSSIAQQLSQKRDLRSNTSITGLYVDRDGMKTAATLDNEIRVLNARYAETSRQLERVNKEINGNRQGWQDTGTAVAATTSKYEEQHKALDKELQQLTAQRLELTKGYRARLEYEAMQQQGVKTAAQLDAGTRSRIDSLVKEHAAIDGAKDARKASTKAARDAETQQKRDISAALQFAKALSELSEQMGGDLHAAMEQYNQDLAKFDAIAAKGKVSAEDMAKAKAMLDERLARTTDTIRAGIEGPQAEAALEYARALKLVETNGRALGMSDAALAEAEKRLAVEYRATTQEIERRLNPAQAMLDDLEFELTLLRMTNAERETAIQLRGMDVEAVRQYGAAILEANRTLETQKRVVADQVDLMDAFRDSARGIASDIYRGKNAWDAVKDAFDRFADAIFDFASKRVMEQLFGQSGTTQTGSAGGGWASLLSSFVGGGSNASTGSVMNPISGQTMTSGGSSGGWWATAASWLGSLFGGGRANGGPTFANKMYEVNERGPEILSSGGKTFLMMGSQGGYVSPMGGGGSGMTVHQHFPNAKLYDRRSDTQRQSYAAMKLKEGMKFA